MTLPKRMNFRKSFKGWGGSLSIQKLVLHIFDLYTGIFTELFRGKFANITFRKWGGAKGHLDLFQNFIRFGSVTRPLT